MARPDGHGAKTAAIRAVLVRAGKPLTLDVLLPRLEVRLRQVIGRSRLYRLLSVMQCAGQIATTGRGAARAYWWKG